MYTSLMTCSLGRILHLMLNRLRQWSGPPNGYTSNFNKRKDRDAINFSHKVCYMKNKNKLVSICSLFKIALFPATLVIAWFYYPHSTTGPTICLWKNLTGKSCFGCGMTRAICAFVHGNIHEALIYNQMVPIVILSLAWISLSETKHKLKEIQWQK